jgi:hypothetical protein
MFYDTQHNVMLSFAYFIVILVVFLLSAVMLSVIHHINLAKCTVTTSENWYILCYKVSWRGHRFIILFYSYTSITHDILKIHWSFFTNSIWRQNILDPLHLKLLRPFHFLIQFSDRIRLFCTVYKLPF